MGWNTEESGSGTSYKASQQVNLSELKETDGTGTAYSDKAVIENGLTRENGATIKLYAQWAACEHPPQIVYREDKWSGPLPQ